MDSPGAPRRSRFHLPWRHSVPGQEPASEAPAPEATALERPGVAARQAEQERQRTDRRLLSEGGIPSRARQRLSRARGAGIDELPFTSDLSPDEAALLRRNGYRPLGLVSGGAMYHIGNSYPPTSFVDCEVQVLSDAYTDATGRAVSRMQQEATLLGAHGVVGVRFTMARHERRQRRLEIQLLGTAVAGPGAPAGAPWLSDLSGQDWWALQRAGYDPVGLVYGHCAWFIVTTELDELCKGRFAPAQELDHCSEALRECRERANGRVRQMARQYKAHGVVGVHISRQLEAFKLGGLRANTGMKASSRIQEPVEIPAWGYTRRGHLRPAYTPAMASEHHNLTLSIIGTAIRLRQDAPRAVRATRPVLSLRASRLVPGVVSTGEATFD